MTFNLRWKRLTAVPDANVPLQSWPNAAKMASLSGLPHTTMEALHIADRWRQVLEGSLRRPGYRDQIQVQLPCEFSLADFGHCGLRAPYRQGRLCSLEYYSRTSGSPLNPTAEFHDPGLLILLFTQNVSQALLLVSVVIVQQLPVTKSTMFHRIQVRHQ